MALVWIFIEGGFQATGRGGLTIAITVNCSFYLQNHHPSSLFIVTIVIIIIIMEIIIIVIIIVIIIIMILIIIIQASNDCWGWDDGWGRCWNLLNSPQSFSAPLVSGPFFFDQNINLCATFVRENCSGANPVLSQSGSILVFRTHTKSRDFQSAIAEDCPHS